MLGYIKKYLQDRDFIAYRDKCIKSHHLSALFWECTTRCNLSCLHCGSDCMKQSSIPDMSISDFISVLDDIKANHTSRKLSVYITGGEPLLRKDLEEAGKAVINHGFRWGIVTNGMLFNRERFKSLIEAGLTALSFSLDGLEEEHTYLRQHPQSYKKVIEAIDIVNEYRKKYPKTLAFDIITCVHKGNIHILPKLRDLLIEHGVKHWRIFSIFPEGRAYENDLSITGGEYKKVLDFIVESNKYTLNGSSIQVDYACEGYLGTYERKARRFPFFCRGGVNVASVWCDGNVSACLSVRGKDFIQGNIYKRSFSDIWNNEFGNMRDRSWAKIGKCKNCSKWKLCLGNGIHLHHSTTSPVAHCNLELLGQYRERIIKNK